MTKLDSNPLKMQSSPKSRFYESTRTTREILHKHKLSLSQVFVVFLFVCISEIVIQLQFSLFSFLLVFNELENAEEAAGRASSELGH